MANPETLDTYADEFGAEFQFHILAVCARTPDFILRYRSALDPAYFANPVAQLVAQALFQHIDAQHTLPHRSTLLESCRDVAPAKDQTAIQQMVGDLFAEDIQDVAAVAEKAVNFGKTQAMANAVLAAAKEIDRGNKQNVIPIVQKAALVGEDLLDLGLPYADWPTRKKWYLQPEEEKQENIIPTGLPHLDYALGGGIRRGELAVVLSPPKRGKTTTLINFGFGALTRAAPPSLPGRRGFNVLHLSLEMHQDDILRRYDDRLAGPAFIKIKHTDRERYVAHLEARQRLILGDLYVKSYPTRTLTATKIRSLLTLLHANQFAPDLLIVDYADIMKAERRLGEMRHEQAGVYEDLRTIAGEYNLACWTGSQAGRGSLEKDIITIADFAESFEKSAIVDGAVAFCQTKDERASSPQQARLFLAAYRNREDGRTIQCNVRRDCCRLQTVSLLDPALGPIELPDRVAATIDAETDTEGAEVSAASPAKTKRRVQHIPADPKPTPKQTAHMLRREHITPTKPAKRYIPPERVKKKKSGKTTRRKTDRPNRKV